MNNRKIILLIEDNTSDVDLTKSLEKGRIANELVVIRDGTGSAHYLWGEGAYAGREVSDLPAVTLLDFKLPKVPGLEMLRRVRADARDPVLPLRT